MGQTLMAEPTITKVHEDSRGELYAINLPGDRELMLLHSKAGSVRGGHSHDVPERVMVLTGKLQYHKLSPTGIEVIAVLQEGEYSYNAAGEIHMGEFPEDSWILEWKICPDKHSWKNTDYAPWRERVMANAR
mgnify:FL=1